MRTAGTNTVVATPREELPFAGTGTDGPVAERGKPPREPDPRYVHLQPVWLRFLGAAADSTERTALRDELALAYQPVVDHIARRYSRHSRDTHDDLVQIGTLGLLKAIDGVAPERITSDVLAYLIPCIRGEMQRHFRDRTWVMRTPRRLKDLSVAIARETPELSQRLERAPRPSELAAALDADVGEVIEALHARSDQHPGSLDSTQPGGIGTVADALGAAEPAYDTIVDREAVRPLIQALPARERTILTLRFFQNMTQTQIAQHMGIYQMHVSRLLASTLAQLRKGLADIERHDLTADCTRAS